MTLKEIAKEANVSVSTVSRVINNKGKGTARKDVQDRIWKIVRRTGYVPNVSAQKLRKGLSTEAEQGSLACLFARTPNAINDPFFSLLAKSVENEALRLNFILKYSFTALDFNNRNTLKQITGNHADGVVILGRCDIQILELLKRHFKCISYVGLNRLNTSYNKSDQIVCDQVTCDGLEASVTAVNYLIELGHKNIGYIGEVNNEERYVGYRKAMIAGNLPIENARIVNSILSSEGGYKGVKRLLSQTRDVTAVFCPNDITSIGAMRAFQEDGMCIPEDISIISIDDIDMSKYISPMLTTVHIPIEEMGNMGAKILVDRIHKGHKLPTKIVMPFQLKIRESCAKPRMK